jgi:hypothetical protein
MKRKRKRRRAAARCIERAGSGESALQKMWPRRMGPIFLASSVMLLIVSEYRTVC